LIERFPFLSDDQLLQENYRDSTACPSRFVVKYVIFNMKWHPWQCQRFVYP